MRKSVRIILVLSVLLSLQTILAAQEAFEVDVRTEVKIPMRDGVELSANIFLPKAQGKFPAILVRTPYGKEGDERRDVGLYFANQGYAFVIQDCRGKGSSQGVWEPFANERNDGRDTQKWLLEQPWCNGSIGTASGSYEGFTQWISAPNAGDHLKAMWPAWAAGDTYGFAYTDGALNLSLMMSWGCFVALSPEELVAMYTWSEQDWTRAFRTLPLKEWDRALGRKVQYLRDWVAHPHFDEYWAARGVRNQWQDITVPICAVGGWYDIFSMSVIEHVNAVRAKSRSQDARKHQHLVMGPWSHGISQDGKVGDLNFGKEAVIKLLREMQTKWFDCWLKDDKTGADTWPAFRIFVMGRNQWRDEQQWPLERTEYTPYYFRSKGSANTAEGDGKLATAKPSEETSDEFVYDPNDPVPTAGGCNYWAVPAGPRDQSQVEKRNDVLVFTSETLKTELEVTGPVKVILYASSTAKDTDFTAKLLDVHPDGRPFNLCDGIARASYRDSKSAASLIQPGKVYRYEIDLWVTSNAFLPGHKIRVEISSSNFPRFDRNLNTGEPFGTGTEFIKATQTIYHDKIHPSHILLPVIP